MRRYPVQEIHIGSSINKPSVQTDKQTNILLLYYKNCTFTFQFLYNMFFVERERDNGLFIALISKVL